MYTTPDPAALPELASFAVPCRATRASFADGRFEQISQGANPGCSQVYARVLTTEVARPGDVVEITER